MDTLKNIAIIPARSGSKGLKDKNIKLLKGMPLMGYSINVARNSQMFDEIMVSTDSTEYAEVAVQCGASVPFLRSEQNSQDSSSSWSVVAEVLENYEKIGRTFDTICLLQPTSPFRNENDIIKGYRELIDKNADAITSVCELDHSLEWCMRLPDDNSMVEFRKSYFERPRQDTSKYYRINGSIYIRKITYDNGKANLIENMEYAYVMDKARSIDIDTEDDFAYAEWMMCKSL